MLICEIIAKATVRREDDERERSKRNESYNHTFMKALKVDTVKAKCKHIT